MRAIMESGFYVLYLVLIMFIGLKILLKGDKTKGLFGAACIVLGFGDAFHLIPRAVGLFSGTLDNPSATLNMWLGVGKLITGITMTAFYLFLYRFIMARAVAKRGSAGDFFVGLLAVARFVLCAMPQNGWAENRQSVLWGTWRNIPFVILGIFVIILAFKYLKGIKHFKFLWLAIILSFAFYIPVVLFAGKYPIVGMLMLPKTICYLWIGFMGYKDLKAK